MPPAWAGERGSLFCGVAAAPAPPSPGLPALPGETRGALGPVTRFVPGASSGAPWVVQCEKGVPIWGPRLFPFQISACPFTTVAAGDSSLFLSASLRFQRAALGGKLPGCPPTNRGGTPPPPPLCFGSLLSLSVLSLERARAVTGCSGLNGAGAQTRRSPRDFPHPCLSTLTPAAGVQFRLTQPSTFSLQANCA